MSLNISPDECIAIGAAVQVPFTVDRKPYIVHRTTYNVQRTTYNVQRTTYTVQQLRFYKMSFCFLRECEHVHVSIIIVLNQDSVNAQTQLYSH